MSKSIQMRIELFTIPSKITGGEVEAFFYDYDKGKHDVDGARIVVVDIEEQTLNEFIESNTRETLANAIYIWWLKEEAKRRYREFVAQLKEDGLRKRSVDRRRPKE